MPGAQTWCSERAAMAAFTTVMHESGKRPRLSTASTVEWRRQGQQGPHLNWGHGVSQSVACCGRSAGRNRIDGFRRLSHLLPPIALALILVGLVLTPTAGASSSLCTSRADARQWSHGSTPQQWVFLTAVSFVDTTRGWAVGQIEGPGYTESGIILATTDGGAVWARQDSGDVGSLSDVDFVDRTHGWATGWDPVAHEGVILATSDGGSHWWRQDTGVWGIFKAVCFSDATHGWVTAYDDPILATSDGGGAWSNQASPSGLDLRAIAFGDASHGCAVGWNTDTYKAAILTTVNGGATWTRHNPAGVDVLTGVTFVDAKHAWAVGRYWSSSKKTYGNNAVIMSTADGGLTWNRRPLASALYPEDVAFSDMTHGWVVGAYGPILATADGGITWSKQSTKIGAELSGVAFSDASRGWAVGENGAILATADGGATWGRQVSGVSRKPTITRIKPTSGKRGTMVTISGSGFYLVRSTSQVKFGRSRVTRYHPWDAWDRCCVKCRVPGNAKHGRVKVTVGTVDGISNAVTFTVKR